MLLKVLGVLTDILLSPDEVEEKPRLHVSDDDGYTDAIYDDGGSNEYERGWDGEIRDIMGNKPN